MNTPRKIKINFENESHRNAILKLCEINNKYYYEDIFCVINLERFKKNQITEEEIINTIIKKDGNDMKAKILKTKYGNLVDFFSKYMEERFEGMEWYGEFVVEGTKVVGFIINSWSKPKNQLFIEFILIDKKYRNKGYATNLIRNVQNRSKIMKCRVGTQPDNKNIREWFKQKFNFKENEEIRDVLYIAGGKDRIDKIFYYDDEVYRFELEKLNENIEHGDKSGLLLKFMNEIDKTDPEKAELISDFTHTILKLYRR